MNKYYYTLHENQFGKFYYKIYKDKEMVEKSKLYKWEEECVWDASGRCHEYNYPDCIEEKSIMGGK